MVLAKGTTFGGKYKIIEEIGRGGMGVVYKAQDLHLDRFAALKILPPERVADPDRKRRFVQEAKAASALNHPNIITIYDIDQEGGMDFIAMEYVAGKTLDELIGGKGLKLNETLKCGIQIADALAAAHETGIVHRDLKPGNVMVTERGLVKVLDFGLAKLTEPGSGELAPTQTLKPYTEEGMILGTVAYMSPEQAEGKRVDARSDIFSFGSMLYEMLTGCHAFQGDSKIAVLSAILHQEPAAIEGVPPELDKIIGRCLRKDPDRRIQHMVDVKLALEELKDRELPIDIRRPATPSSPDRVLQATRKHLRLWIPAALVLTILIALLVVWDVGGLRYRLTGAAESGPIRSIAVLPLENLSGNPEQEYFVDGITDAITTELGKISGFERVISWQSMKRYKNTTKSAEEIAKEVNVDALVEGIVLREGNRVRISPKLIRVKPEKQLWANSYDRDLHGILSLHSEVARAIVQEVRVSLGGGELGRSSSTPSVNPEAYDYYLRGNQYLEQPYEEAHERLAIQMYERATALDPKFSQAYARLAYAHALLWVNYYDRTETRRDAARESARKALQLQPQSAEAHLAMGWVYYYGYLDYARALEDFAAAQRINPNDSEVQAGIAAVKRRQGKFQEASVFFEKATTLNPNFATHFFDLAVTYALLCRYPEAERPFIRALSLKPQGQFYARRAWFALLEGKRDVARATLAEAQDKALKYQLIPYYWYQLELWTGDYAAALSGLF
jgi:serine/threonine protein kinase/tetratricopeptide (TPR) repeat protein